jgi:hypothetical protein
LSGQPSAGRLGESQGLPVTVAVRSDFEELKEDEVIDITSNLTGITGNIKRSFKARLGRRNTYTHPSTMTISTPQVDDMITDLVNQRRSSAALSEIGSRTLVGTTPNTYRITYKCSH